MRAAGFLVFILGSQNRKLAAGYEPKMNNQDRILAIVQQRGPLLPSQINKEIGVDVLFASAMLSELCDKRLLRLTKLKVGGSPLYYLPGQEQKLTGFADKLGEKDQRACDRLKQEGVLLDSEQDALFRTALRNIQDFAIPLDVNAQGQRHIFWKWYLLPNQDAEKRIMDKLGIGQDEKETAKREAKEDARGQERSAPKEQVITVDVSGTTKIETAAEQDSLPSPPPGSIPKNVPTKPEPKKDTAPRAQRREERDRRKDRPEEKDDDAKKERTESITDMFHRRVLEYFERNDIKIESTNIVRSGADIEFLIHLPTSVGLVPYFCKAKNKKRCNDDDMAKAYLSGQKRRLPTLFLYTGDLTKKAKNSAASEYRTVILREV